MFHRLHPRLAAAGLIALLAAGVGGTPARAEVDVQLSPSSQTVAPGAEFEVTLTVTNASPAFNAVHAIVGFDPAALTTVKLSPISSQIGALMTAACGSFYHQFHTGTNVDTVDVSMLCAGASVTGPGTVYRMHFRASSTSQATAIRLYGVEFANGGILLSNVVTKNAAVGIGTTVNLGVGGPGEGAGVALAAFPNPAAGAVMLDFGRPLGAGGALAVHDVQGRLLRSIPVAPGARAGAWDGCDATGRRVAPGEYVLALRTGTTLRTAHVTQVR